MLRQDELQALVELLARTPMSTAEALWSRQLVARLKRTLSAEIQEREKKEQTDGERGEDGDRDG